MATNLMWILSVLLLFLWGYTPSLALVCNYKEYDKCTQGNSVGPCMLHAYIVDCLKKIQGKCSDDFLQFQLNGALAYHQERQDACPNVPRGTCYEILPKLCTALFPDFNVIPDFVTPAQLKEYYIPKKTCEVVLREEKMRRDCIKKFEALCGTKDAKAVAKNKMADLDKIIKACNSPVE